jgi:hypothetical protein
VVSGLSYMPFFSTFLCGIISHLQFLRTWPGAGKSLEGLLPGKNRWADCGRGAGKGKAEVRVLTPTTPCLWCRKTIDADVIRAENLPEQERRRQEREGYVVRSVGDPVPSVVALTVLGSGLSTCALLTLLSEEGMPLLVIWSMAFLAMPTKPSRSRRSQDAGARNESAWATRRHRPSSPNRDRATKLSA